MKVTLIDRMGSDLSVVNAARVSFNKFSDWEFSALREGLSERDKGLIRFLARGCTTGDWESLNWDVENCGTVEELNDILNYIRRMPPHWTPFGHTAITLHMKVPVFVARQIHKHQVGFVVNEVSRRYVTDEPEFYEPEVWRKAADNVKQGSSDEAVSSWEVGTLVPIHNHNCLNLYNKLLGDGVCPEQARMILPQSTYTEFWMTGNLFGWANLFNQRTDPHAQREVQEVAHMIGELIEPHYPESWKALTQ